MHSDLGIRLRFSSGLGGRAKGRARVRVRLRTSPRLAWADMVCWFEGCGLVLCGGRSGGMSRQSSGLSKTKLSFRCGKS